MNDDDRDKQRPTSGKPQRTGQEAPYTSEVFEVDPEVGTDSPLGAARDADRATPTVP